MNTGFSPEERARIAEEQHIRNQENLKYGLKSMGKVYLIGGGIFLIVICCMCLCIAIFSTTILSNFNY